MIKNKIIGAVMMTCAAVFCAIAGERPADVGGWSTTKWGMAEEDIIAALPGQATRLTSPANTRTYPTGTVNVGIESMNIVNHDFKIHFLMDKKDKLARVLVKTGVSELSESVAQNLQALLVEKYGTPTFADKTIDRDLKKRVAKWVFPSTIIQMDFMSAPLANIGYLVVVYEKNTGKDLDKM